MNNDLVRWRYMRKGDILEYRNESDIVKQIGPILEIEFRPDRDNYYAPEKKYVIVPSLIHSGKRARVHLDCVQAVIRGGVEMIRFLPNEQQSVGCATCGQREIDPDIAGRRFCSLHCQFEWIERYYSDYPPGQNPIDKGESIHFANCGACRRLNRTYCPNCVD